MGSHESAHWVTWVHTWGCMGLHMGSHRSAHRVTWVCAIEGVVVAHDGVGDMR